MIGHTVGHYRVLERLGGGGMGIVYKAEDTKLGRCVALKFLPPELTRDEEARTRFLHEARAAAQIDHPNICTVYDVGEADDDRVWIAMACYEGDTLRKIIERQRLPVDDAVRIVLQLARGLAKAHSSGIVHRDIKPANVMVTNDGVVKILDFGLAKLEGASQITAAGRAIGTTAYMSPEQLRCEAVGPQADIWSLGVVTFELLAGERPFKGEYEQAAIYSILNSDAASLRATRGDVPAELDRIVARMLRRDPRDRYRSVDEVIADLEAFVTPGGSRSHGIVAAARRVARRAWKPVAVSAGALLAVVALLALGSRLGNHEPSAAPAAPPAMPENVIVGVLPFQDISEESLGPMIGAGFGEALSASLGAARGLQVVSIGSQDLAEGSSPREVCRRTGTNLVLKGTLHRYGDGVRATWTIVDADGRQRGSGSADAPVGRLLLLQDAIGGQVLAALSRPDKLPASTAPGEQLLAEDRYVEAVGYLTRYDDEPSVDSAIELLEALGDTPRVKAALGSAYLAKFILSGREKEWALKAKDACEAARATGADDPEIHRTLGKYFVATAKYDEAEAEFARALELRPNDADTRIAFADLLDKQDKPKEAEAEYRKAIELRPGNWAGHNQLGTFFLKRGKPEEALEVFSSAERLTPGNNFAITNAGVALQWLGRYDEALAAYDRSIRVRPTGPVFNNKGTLLYMLGRYDDAADALRTATALNPGDAQLWLGLADALRWSETGRGQSRGAYLKAIDLAEAELAINPRDPTNLSILAVCYAKLGDAAKAVQTAKLAVETAPGNMIVNYNSGVAMEVAGERDMAVRYIGRALSQGYTPEELRRDPELRALADDPTVLSAAKEGGV